MSRQLTFSRLRKMLGFQPSLHGLENLLEDLQAGSLSVEDAAEQIRDLAAQPHIPRWFPHIFRVAGGIMVLVGIGLGIYSTFFSFGTE